MMAPPRISRSGATFAAFAGLVDAAMVVASAHWRGLPISLTGDPAVYVQVAGRLALEGRLVDCADVALTHFPPLYPALLALPIALGLPPIDAITVVVALCRALTTALCGIFLLQAGARGWVTALGIASIILSDASFIALNGAQSEVPYVTLTMGLLVALQRFRASGTMAALLVASALAAAATLTRYVGILGQGFGVLVVLAFTFRGRGLRPAVVFAAVTAAPVIYWLVRNSLISDGPVGDRGAGGHDPLATIIFFAERVAEWFVMLPGLGSATRLWMVSAGLVALGVLAARHRRQAPDLWWSAALSGGFALSFLVGLGLLRLVVEAEMSTRMIIPILPPLILAVALAIGCVMTGRSRSGRLAAVALWSIWLAIPTKNVMASVFGLHSNAPLFASAPTVRADMTLSMAASEPRIVAADLVTADWLFLHLGRCVPLDMPPPYLRVGINSKGGHSLEPLLPHVEAEWVR